MISLNISQLGSRFLSSFIVSICYGNIYTPDCCWDHDSKVWKGKNHELSDDQAGLTQFVHVIQTTLWHSLKWFAPQQPLIKQGNCVHSYKYSRWKLNQEVGLQTLMDTLGNNFTVHLGFLCLGVCLQPVLSSDCFRLLFSAVTMFLDRSN